MGAETAPRVCRGCGCMGDDGCVVRRDGRLTMCFWVEPDLCSACAVPIGLVCGPLRDHRLDEGQRQPARGANE